MNLIDCLQFLSFLLGVLEGASSPAGESRVAGLPVKAQDMAAAMRMKAAGAAEGLAGGQDQAAPAHPPRGMLAFVQLARGPWVSAGEIF